MPSHRRALCAQPRCLAICLIALLALHPAAQAAEEELLKARVRELLHREAAAPGRQVDVVVHPLPP